MKLTKESLLVKQAMAQFTANLGVDTDKCLQYVAKLTVDMPDVKAKTVDEADKVVGDVLQWLRSLGSKQVGCDDLSKFERVAVYGILLTEIDELNLAVEKMLFDLGVVERGETDT